MSFFGVPLRNGLPIGLGSSAGFGVPAFNPQQLFSNGEQGVWYDPSDFGTMFQDVAGTTPVTAVGQSVALIRDKSGRGNDATQSVAGSRPTVNVDSNGKYFLLFDGVDDGMLTGNINFSSTDKTTVWIGLRKLSDAARGMAVEFGIFTTNPNGTFQVNAPDNNFALLTYSFASQGTAFSNQTNVGGYAAPTTNILTGIGDIGADIATLRVNGGAQVQTNSTDQGTGNYGNYPLYVGRRGNATIPFNGRVYSLIVRGAQSTAAQISNTEYWVADRTGISL